MTKWDKILVILMILLSISGLTAVSAMGMNSNEKYAVIKVNGEIIKRISIDGKEKNHIYEYQFGEGSKGFIEINNGQVRILEMDQEICPEGICSNTGWISKKYQSIVCLPNKITVSFEQKMDDELDIISH